MNEIHSVGLKYLLNATVGATKLTGSALFNYRHILHTQ